MGWPSGCSRFIAVIVPSLANAVFIEVINGLRHSDPCRTLLEGQST